MRMNRVPLGDDRLLGVRAGHYGEPIPTDGELSLSCTRCRRTGEYTTSCGVMFETISERNPCLNA